MHDDDHTKHIYYTTHTGLSGCAKYNLKNHIFSRPHNITVDDYYVTRNHDPYYSCSILYLYLILIYVCIYGSLKIKNKKKKILTEPKKKKPFSRRTHCYRPQYPIIILYFYIS